MCDPFEVASNVRSVDRLVLERAEPSPRASGPFTESAGPDQAKRARP